MGNVIKFHSQGKEYPLSILDADGQNWVYSQQVAEAMGIRNIRSLLQDLIGSREITEERHYRRVTLQNSSPGNPTRTILSYRGVIRVAMRSQGQRAKEFRDWAEEVLYQVMTTGSYLDPGAVEKAHELGLQRGISLAVIAEQGGLTVKAVAKFCYFRKLGATQKEAGAVCGLTRDRAGRLERHLRETGIHFQSVHGLKRDRMFLDELCQAEGGAS